MPSFRFCVLGFLSVSFHPTQFRSHSCSTGDHLSLSPSVPSPSFPLSFVRFFSGSDYSAFAFSFPFIPASPCLGLSGADLSVSLPACCHAFRFTLVLSLPAFLFSASLFRNTGATSVADLLFPARSFPLAYALGSGYSALGEYTLKTEHHYHFCIYLKTSLSLRFGQAFGLLVSVS